MKIHLPDVTLCALDTANVALTLRAIEKSREGCDFGDVVLISSQAVTANFRTELIKPFSTPQEAGVFFTQQMAQYIKTPLILSIQYDGYVVHPTAWNPEFLNYDYIGAKWSWYTDGMNVGNSGFCLLSKKLLDLWGNPKVNPTRGTEDDHLCRTLRPKLETKYGIRFAPEAVADLFSYENSLPQQPTFGFHGLFNIWRHLDDKEMEQTVDQLADYVLSVPDYAKLLVHLYMTRKFIPLRVFYARARQKHTAQDMMRRFSQALTPESAARDCLAVCENLIKGIVSKEVASGVGLSPANESVLKAQLSSFWQGHR